MKGISHSMELKSPHMKGFQLHECTPKGCMKSFGAVGYISAQGDILSAESVVLQLFSDKNKLSPSKEYHCENYRYDLKAKFLWCDLITIDSQFKVTEYNIKE